MVKHKKELVVGLL